MILEIARLILRRSWTNCIEILFFRGLDLFTLFSGVEFEDRFAHLYSDQLVGADTLCASKWVLDALDVAEAIEGGDLGVLDLKPGVYLLKLT